MILYLNKTTLTGKKVIIIGGGAAGFFAAINTAQKHANYQITLVEKSSKLLSKVRISGGGRCNVTHECLDNQLLIKNYPRGEKELRSVFSKFSVQDTVVWFEKRNVPLKTEPDGRMFPASNDSAAIVNCLLQEAHKSGVNICTNTEVESIALTPQGTFKLSIKNSSTIIADTILIATGGNAKESAYTWLSNLGHRINKPIPSLFTFNIPNHPITQLMGIAVQHARVKIENTKIETSGPLLITHWGLSGPAILKASAWGALQLHQMNYQFKVSVNWLPKFNEEKLRIELGRQRTESPSKTIINTLCFELPKRLWEYLIHKAAIDNSTRWADLSKKQTHALLNILLNDTYPVNGKTTFKEEFVICGGVDLKEIDLSTMQSKLIQNLYFAGEIINVDGVTGGFNFQNAWSTAWIAAQHL